MSPILLNALINFEGLLPAAARIQQSCPTLCDPEIGSQLPIHRIIKATTLEWLPFPSNSINISYCLLSAGYGSEFLILRHEIPNGDQISREESWRLA